jgi:TetR/AcrR family transcriptional repressor of nem operon
MRRSREDAAETRRKIVDAAARLFRGRGIAGVGIADVMSALGMTVGGFYRHFASKDALVAEAIEAASVETTTGSRAFAHAVKGKAAAMIDGYLSRLHRDHPDNGCPVAALCTDVAHEKRATREVFTTALRRLVDTIAIAIPGDTKDARERRLFTAAALVGALVLSRATTDTDLADAVLDATRKQLRDV